MADAYFDEDFRWFLRHLARNNTKEWFDDHRKLYQQKVKAPFEHFVADVVAGVMAQDPDFTPIDPRKLIFRINRDIRFAKDKPPYKPFRSAVICRAGKKAEEPMFYVRLAPDEVWVGAGLYNLGTAGRGRVREAIASEPQTYRAIAEAPAFRKAFGDIQGEQTKTLPKALKPAAEELPVLFNKQFYAMTTLPGGLTTSPELFPTLMEYHTTALPLIRWFRRALGPMAAG